MRVLLIALLTGVLSACSARDGAPEAPGASQSATAVSTPTPSLTATLPPAVKAPPTITGAKRPGVTGKPTLTAAGQSMTGTVSYSDAVTVKIVKIGSDVVKGQGRGVSTGIPMSLFTVEVQAGKQRVDLGSVVLTAVYGANRNLAQPVYASEAVRDFSGVLAPGGKASGVYAFAIPTGERARVELYVDLDGKRTPAKFSGSLS